MKSRHQYIIGASILVVGSLLYVLFTPYSVLRTFAGVSPSNIVPESIVNYFKGAIGIGLPMGQAPTASLDVAGKIQADGAKVSDIYRANVLMTDADGKVIPKSVSYNSFSFSVNGLRTIVLNNINEYVEKKQLEGMKVCGLKKMRVYEKRDLPVPVGCQTRKEGDVRKFQKDQYRPSWDSNKTNLQCDFICFY